MQRTMRLRLYVNDDDRSALFRTMEAYTVAFDLAAENGYRNRTHNKMEVHKATYRHVRDSVPDLPSSLVQGARDCACEALKALRKQRHDVQPKRFPHSAIRYDGCMASIYLESKYATLVTVNGRVRVTFGIPAYFDKYAGWTVRSSNLVYDRSSKTFFLCVTVETKDAPEPTNETAVLGIDRGIKNVAVTSANKFYSSKDINRVHGEYQHLRAELRSKGTRSAKRKLCKISGRERRFQTDVNHRITKQIANSPYGVFALEDLKGIRMNKKGSSLGTWAFYQFEAFLRYKAEERSRTVLLVDPAYTSQRCPRCDHTNKSNRHGAVFRCKECGLELHSDLVGSRNIAQLGMSELSRLSVDQPNIACHDPEGHSLGRAQLQALPSEVR